MFKLPLTAFVLVALMGCIDAQTVTPLIAADDAQARDPDRDMSGPPRSGEPPMPVVDPVPDVRRTVVPVPSTCPLSPSEAARNNGKSIDQMIADWPRDRTDDIDILERVRAGISVPEETAYARNCLGLTTS